MNDTSKLLPESREYFRKFIQAHRKRISGDVKEFLVGPGTGYSPCFGARMRRRKEPGFLLPCRENERN